MVELRQSEMQSRVAAREAAQISTMMADMARVVENLDSEIAAEERRVRVSDPRNVAYPIVARACSARRQNLITTMSVLASRLNSLSDRNPPA